MSYAVRDGVRLYYEEQGDGEPALVFVHGWCCDHTCFTPQVEDFRASHRTITLDLRGCGASDVPDEGYDIPTMADDVAWLCRQVGLTDPIIVGHSLGGSIAVELAARYPTLPSAVVALDPGPLHSTPEAQRVYTGLADQLDGPEGEAVREVWVRDDVAMMDDQELAHRILETMCSVPLPIAAAVIRHSVAWNGLAALAMCRAPLLVVLTEPRGSNAPERLRAIRPDVRVGVTVGSGHFHQLEVPDQINAMVARFLETSPSCPA
jgi:pimeloyl-ACP methyl ester carboxylesterase